MILTCERCGDQTAKLEKCNYCNQQVCVKCMKAAKKIKRKSVFICKTCWGKMKTRKKYKGLDQP